MSRKEEIKQMIRATCAKHLGTEGYRVFIFGSQANLPELKRADVDVGIDSTRKIRDEEIMHMREALNDMNTLYWFDVVNFNGVTEEFRKAAMQNIEMI
jgi:predicted nucleotidyltransferase